MDNSSSITPVNATNFDFNEETAMPLFQIIFIVIMAIIMFGMGCAVELDQLRHNLKNPAGLVVGLVCQIILMPVLTYSLISLSSMPATQGIAFMLVGCSPGGTHSNIVTYLINGDISLSVAMTTFSNLLALGTVPLVVLCYTAIQDIEEDLRIPYDMLGYSLLTMVIPITIGFLVRYKLKDRVRLIPKICAIVGVITLVATIITTVLVTDMPFEFSSVSFLPVGILPIVGLVVSYVICLLPQLKLTKEARKAISMETAVQSGGLAITVIVLSFGKRIDIMGKMLSIPLLYNIYQTSLIVLIAVAYHIWLYRQKYVAHQQKDDRKKCVTSQLDKSEKGGNEITCLVSKEHSLNEE